MPTHPIYSKFLRILKTFWLLAVQRRLLLVALTLKVVSVDISWLRLAEAFELEREEQEASLAQIGAEGIAADEARARAEGLLEDLRAFIDVGNTFQNGMEVARAVQALMSAIQSGDQDELGRALTIANKAFGDNSDFGAFRSDRDQLNNETRNNALAVARARAEATNEFIIATLARNPLDPNPALLTRTK